MKLLNELKSKEDLAQYLGIPVRKLTYILYKRTVESYYKSFEIPKKNGGTRYINASQNELKDIQKKLAQLLWDFMVINKIRLDVVHAFEKKKGIISNAKIHRNKRFILKIDLENFFDNIHFGRIRGFFEKNRKFKMPIEIATMIAQLTCYKGCLPQGAPSSPILSNLLCGNMDRAILKLSRKFKLNYTRYADDMVFSTNDKNFMEQKEEFVRRLEEIIDKSGFAINQSKTRFILKDSRQTVTGLVVNKKVSVTKDFVKKTRAMANSLYRQGEFSINGVKGTIRQLEGRFSFINQIDKYNDDFDNKFIGKKPPHAALNSREKQFQKFLFYKYFFANPKALIVTEGKTDIRYIKAALKACYQSYPRLITKKDGKFNFHISFLKKTKRLRFFLAIHLDGADTMNNICSCYNDKNGLPNFNKQLKEISTIKKQNPVVLVFDNETKKNNSTKRPLKKTIDYIQSAFNITCNFDAQIQKRIIDNLYILTNPLPEGKEEAAIEDLFDNETLSVVIDGKRFSRDNEFDPSTHYGKNTFSKYIIENYEKINFSGFKEMLDTLDAICSGKISKTK